MKPEHDIDATITMNAKEDDDNDEKGEIKPRWATCAFVINTIDVATKQSSILYCML